MTYLVHDSLSDDARRSNDLHGLDRCVTLLSHLTFNLDSCLEEALAKDLAVQHTETHGAAWGVMDQTMGRSGRVQGLQLMHEILAPVPLLVQHLKALRRPVVAQQVLLDVGHPVALQEHTLSVPGPPQACG